MTTTATGIKRRFRGVILKLLYENQEAQRHRLDDVTMTCVLERLQFDVYVDGVREILQDLKQRGFVSFDVEKNRVTGVCAIREIKITPAGRDIVEKTGCSPAVEVD